MRARIDKYVLEPEEWKLAGDTHLGPLGRSPPRNLPPLEL